MRQVSDLAKFEVESSVKKINKQNWNFINLIIISSYIYFDISIDSPYSASGMKFEAEWFVDGIIQSGNMVISSQLNKTKYLKFHLPDIHYSDFAAIRLFKFKWMSKSEIVRFSRIYRRYLCIQFASAVERGVAFQSTKL